MSASVYFLCPLAAILIVHLFERGHVLLHLLHSSLAFLDVLGYLFLSCTHAGTVIVG